MENHYKADLRELEFALFEQFRLSELLSRAPYAHITADDAHMILKAAHTLAADVIAPTMGPADREGCRLTPEGVRVPAALHDLWRQYYEQGWNLLTFPEEWEGQGAPRMLGSAVVEMMSGAHTAFHMYPGLTTGAAGVIEALGSPEQRELYAGRLKSGEWAGTMVLTEPQAGSDVGLSTARAVPVGDGSYRITGNKIFISGGDHDLTENIVHLVLARIEGAPRGTRGLSLFIIPKRRVNADGTPGEPNDVVCTRLEEKLGIHASATCAISFGENGECVGHLLGGPPPEGTKVGGGLQQMFLLMNSARIGVGTQALGVASTAYLNALAYARQRRQGAHPRRGRPPEGAVPIIEHPDVRRMLMEMKCQVEGCRALLLYTQRQADGAATVEAEDPDRAHAMQEHYGLLIPVVKAHLSDVAERVTSTAIQVLGGAGYTRDFPLEQYCRDARIFPIYEGTNGIQAMDLVGRKLPQEGGALVQRLVAEVEAFGEALGREADFAVEAGHLARAVEGVKAVLGAYLGFLQADRLERILGTGQPFLEVMGRLMCGYLLLDGALVAHRALAGRDPDSHDGLFYRGRIASARYYARHLLPVAAALARAIAAGDDTALEMPDEGFSLSF